MTLASFWEGKLLDASGPTAAVELDVQDQDGELRGNFKVYFDTPTEDDCAEPVRRLAQVGPMRGRFDEKSGTVRLQSEMEIGSQTIVVDLEGTVVDADPHAKRAIYGSYDITKSDELLTLEGGGCVLWQYAGRR
jgi:hypothetical protein